MVLTRVGWGLVSSVVLWVAGLELGVGVGVGPEFESLCGPGGGAPD